METYYTKKEYNDLKSTYEKKLKAANKKIASLEKKIGTLNQTISELQIETVKLAAPTPDVEDHVTE